MGDRAAAAQMAEAESVVAVNQHTGAVAARNHAGTPLGTTSARTMAQPSVLGQEPEARMFLRIVLPPLQRLAPRPALVKVQRAEGVPVEQNLYRFILQHSLKQQITRSAERRVGKACARTCSSRWTANL